MREGTAGRLVAIKGRSVTSEEKGRDFFFDDVRDGRTDGMGLIVSEILRNTLCP